MFGQFSGKALAAILSATMLASLALPSVVLALETKVQVEDHGTADAAAQQVSDLVIDGVDVPRAGEALDDVATVHTAEGETWDVPVLWIDQDLQLATMASEDGTYLPAIAFYVPGAFRIKATNGAYLISLSDELTELYGSSEVVSVFDSAQGITYLLPAHLRDYFTPRTETGTGAGQVPGADGAPTASVPVADPAPADPAPETPAEPAPVAPTDPVPEAPADPVPETPADPAVDPTEPSQPGPENERTPIDVYCAKSVRKSFTETDLEWLLDLVLNKLQPEAINLLIEKFPAFGEAATAGEIGTQIGLYVYNLFGEKDGIPEHENVPTGVLALVDGRAVPVEDSYYFGYMVGIDVATLAKKDENGKVVTDPNTGKWVLIRDGREIETFENTIVHEHFHALMFDYNRVGMTGSLRMSDFVTKPSGDFFSVEQEDTYFFTRLPAWFLEGTASSVENIYDFRQPSFVALRLKDDKLLDSYDMQTLVDNYVGAKESDGTPLNYDLWYADGYDQDGAKIENENSAYVMGYLATLYLCELQARQHGKTSIIGEEDYTVSSEVLRDGLNEILGRLHRGETLDEVISSISPVVDGEKLYNDTMEFQKRFIKGSFYTNGGKLKDGRFAELGDYADGKGSSPFVVDILNYLERVGGQEGRTNRSANGSLLFGFERDFVSPLDRTDDNRSDYLKIIESNKAVISTVPDTRALKDGGKSRSGTLGHDSAKPTKKDLYPTIDVQSSPVPEQARADESANDAKAAHAGRASAASAALALVPATGRADVASLPLAAKTSGAKADEATTAEAAANAAKEVEGARGAVATDKSAKSQIVSSGTPKDGAAQEEAVTDETAVVRVASSEATAKAEPLADVDEVRGEEVETSASRDVPPQDAGESADEGAPVSDEASPTETVVDSRDLDATPDETIPDAEADTEVTDGSEQPVAAETEPVTDAESTPAIESDQDTDSSADVVPVDEQELAAGDEQGLGPGIDPAETQEAEPTSGTAPEADDVPTPGDEIAPETDATPAPGDEIVPEAVVAPVGVDEPTHMTEADAALAPEVVSVADPEPALPADSAPAAPCEA